MNDHVRAVGQDHGFAAGHAETGCSPHRGAGRGRGDGERHPPSMADWGGLERSGLDDL